MSTIPKNSAGKLRVFTYSSDIPPVLTDSVLSIIMSLYDPKNNLVYSGNNPIHDAVGTWRFPIPGYYFMQGAPETNPYKAAVIITYPDGRIESQGDFITVE